MWDGKGVNFSIFSENATAVRLLLYNAADAKEPKESILLRERTWNNWHTYVHGLRPGQFYAFSVDGPYDPSKGLRFNPHKALIDPYAKAITSTPPLDNSVFGYKVGDPAEDLSKDERESSGSMPKSVVTDPAFDWEGDRPRRTPWNETIIYELHVKGFTKRHPEVSKGAEGTYAGLASPKVIQYLVDLGITAVELLPVQHYVTDKSLSDKGLTDYWGYNTIGFFAPHPAYSKSGAEGEQVREFKEMVKALHLAGIEVILDVVYNHTGEGNQMGPTFSFRGLDNTSYYRLSPENPRYYFDFTGTGNSLNMRHPAVIQLIMDSLRYWALDMHIDGFRFDLASTLARELYDVDKLSTFFEVIQQDPVISQAKLIAEPWDLGQGGYQVGNFPTLWAEWNGKYRDTMRRFWRGDENQVAEVASRLGGSSDLYQGTGRSPYASINFITAHDGFTLADLVSYNEKHNEENKEDNRDGSNDNLSWNCGVEGMTDDPKVVELRRRQSKNFFAALLLSQGVPMMVAGDEIGRTQRGNNNAYCQDNEISWVDWNLDQGRRDLLKFCQALIRLRRRHHVLRRKRFFQGRSIFAASKDLLWLQPDGSEMTKESWASNTRQLGVMLVGHAIDEFDEHGERIVDETFLLMMNASPDPVEFVIPKGGTPWKMSVSSQHYKGPNVIKAGDRVGLEGRAMIVLRRPA
jgi:isoamylase